jgi:hypothetical protein
VQQSGELATLDAANFNMVRANGENRGGRDFAKFRDVAGVAIQDGPADSSSYCRSSDLRKGGAPNWFENNGIWPQSFSGLNRFQDLGALGNRVVACIDNLDFDTELSGSHFRRLGLFDLIIVIVGREGKQEA